jgi:hypothetical protein
MGSGASLQTDTFTSALLPEERRPFTIIDLADHSQDRSRLDPDDGGALKEKEKLLCITLTEKVDVCSEDSRRRPRREADQGAAEGKRTGNCGVPEKEISILLSVPIVRERLSGYDQ